MDKRLRHLNNLRSFESAARHQSYSKAATELCLSQSAVSQQMRQLEISLDTKLFIRKNRAMALTQSGIKLLHATQHAFDLLLNSFNDIQCEDIEGDLTITSTPSFSSLWLMPKLHQFSIKHPQIKIRIASSNHFEDLKQSHIDLAIRFGTHRVENETSDDLTCEYFGEDNVYPVCSTQLAQEIDFDAPQDILKSWLINLENAGAYNWEAWFKHANIKNHQSHTQWTEVNSTDIALSAVLSGHGFALAAESLFSQFLNAGTLAIPIKIKHPLTVKRYLVFDPNSAKKARLNIFMSWLKEEMNK
ncbi:LysR substrate-binding domain-containing protein [Pseudoalteromonas denitrificans]|uniref:LysR family transcriptional regulator, glycine cleavage system transcriptional activator n=1 Tax=Pseudoalteromonas denitrificans DSM 6059 TaxID=1123010 RepID=A0A1I1S6R8_9GAMM|nr:LysR substrate-binding domain-containing protein [Pseudoalteromonas denitrificans]SFD42209.1 LysR family transcriptional regulator, glycine cleavage system transcriptional activator [Pseudoalteromonas denitrificans DSM 6059]